MNTFWNYFWPTFAAGLVIGMGAGLFGFRRKPLRARTLSAGALVAVGAALLWHGPLGAADRLTSEVERNARIGLDSWEMPLVTAHLHNRPLTRTLVLSGPVTLDDFQRSELVKIMDTVPGVSNARWSDRAGGPPLIAEASGVAILGFLLGLLVAYLIELRRRYNAQWTW
jgi:hypothetical protein